MDYHSRFPFIFFTRSITSASIISCLKALFSQEGFPVRIISDNGPQFSSNEFISFLAQNDIDHTFSPVYHARANGLIERWHRTLKHQLEISSSYGSKRQSYITNFLASYRATPHSETGQSPSSLLHGREMRWIHNSYCNNETDSDNSQQQTYNHKKYKHPSYRPREKMRVKVPGGSSIRIIERRLSQNTYLMTDGKAWHVSKISKFRERTNFRQTANLQAHDQQNSNRYPKRNTQTPARYIDEFSE